MLTQPIQDAGALRSAVESIQPGDSRANLGELAHGVRALAETVHTPIELHLFSDMQKTGMPANFADMELPANVFAGAASGGSHGQPNWTVESVNAPAQLADPKDPKKSRVQAVIAGYGTPAASKTVSLVVNGKTIATRKVEVPGGRPGNGRVSTARCALRPQPLRDEDRLRRRLSRGRCQRVRGQALRPGAGVVCAPGQRYALPGLLWRGAGRGRTRRLLFCSRSIAKRSADIDPSKYAFVVLSDALALPSIFENALSTVRAQRRQRTDCYRNLGRASCPHSHLRRDIR